MYLSRTSPNSEGESIRRGGQHLTPLPGTRVRNGTKFKFGGNVDGAHRHRDLLHPQSILKTE